LHLTFDESSAAGAALDREIERRVLRHDDVSAVTPYSSAYEAGLILEYQLAREGWRLKVESTGPFRVRLERGSETVTALGDTVELALCRAALRTVGPRDG
jgi:hypothetical protein